MARSSAIGQFCPLSHQQFSKGCSSMCHLTAQTQAFPSTSSSTFPPLALHPATMQPPGCPLVYVTERRGSSFLSDQLKSLDFIHGTQWACTTGCAEEPHHPGSGRTSNHLQELGTQSPHPFQGFTQHRKPPLVNPSPDQLKSKQVTEVKCCYCKVLS